MPERPIVFVHGYASDAHAFDAWRGALAARGLSSDRMHAVQYRSMTDEVSLKDVAEGFDRALQLTPNLDADQPLDAIVHSTGMLVLRTWLARDPQRRVPRLKHLIGIAPATFGSPLAHKGRSAIGALILGNVDFGPDFLESGKQVLDALELGSRYTWDLTHIDQFSATPFYTRESTTPYAFIFCGNQGYSGLKGLVNEKGTDGAVRWAGCALDSRKFIIDLTRQANDADRYAVLQSTHMDAPLIAVPGRDHGSIVSDPLPAHVDAVAKALNVDDETQYSSFYADLDQGLRKATELLPKWQQFVVRAIDERGDGVADYNLQLRATDRQQYISELSADVHPYRADTSFRSFHINLTELEKYDLSKLELVVTAASGTDFVGYTGIGDTAVRIAGIGRAELDLTSHLSAAGPTLFYPHTTTFLELRMNREPLPLDARLPARVSFIA